MGKVIAIAYQTIAPVITSRYIPTASRTNGLSSH